MNRKLTKLLLFLLFSSIVVWVVMRGADLREQLRAKTTATRMVYLIGALHAEQPADTDPQKLRAVLPPNYTTESLVDGWGTPLEVEVTRGDDGSFDYVIISLGRDQERGSCCEKWVADWDEDAVLTESGWLQVWYPEAVGHE